jgi:hypothetical protein
VSGRFNRGLDHFPPEQTWAALYLALGRDVALGELVRHVGPEHFQRLRHVRISQLQIDLIAVKDCRELAALGVETAEFFHDTDYRVPQAIAAAARATGVEGILVPSATGLGDNLIIFPEQLHSASRLVVIESVDPRLYVERD